MTRFLPLATVPQSASRPCGRSTLAGKPASTPFTRRSALLVWVPAALACAWAACPTSVPLRAATLDLSALSRRASVRYTTVPRKVLAFYYPWYEHSVDPAGKPQKSSWKDVDSAKKRIANVAHFPLLGPYHSHDPQVMAQHCTWARQAGIDGWIASWWGKGSPTDRALGPLLDHCRKARLAATIYYETVPPPQTAASASADLLDVLHRYGRHPAWLRVQGKPVVFIYGRAVGQIGLPAWLAVVDEVNRRYPPGAVLIGDDTSRAAARIFDGIHTYNPVGAMKDKSLQELRQWARKSYGVWGANADAFGRISTVTVVPGYDDTKIRKPGLAVDRMDRQLYQIQWEEALAANPHWVLVTSWNEWYEGSEIEPSIEFGDKYLRLTGQFAARFKAAAPRPGAKGPAPADAAAKWFQSAGMLKGLQAALLPDLDSPAVWVLAHLPTPPEVLSWERAAALRSEDARRWPILVYAGGEHYRQTVGQPGDVDAGLLRYLEGGGLLLVLPAGPMPLHYNEHGRAVGLAEKIGLPLSISGPEGGWESPPPGVRLRFVQVGRPLPHVPAEFPFPPEGDVRWRPLVRHRLAPGDRVIPLIELRDETGKHYGDAAALVEHRTTPPKNAKLLYAWFGLLQGPYAEQVAADLVLLAAQQAGRAPGREASFPGPKNR